MSTLSAASGFPCMFRHALDFFSLHRSHALHTLFRALLSLSDEGLVAWVVIMLNGKQTSEAGGGSDGRIGGMGNDQVESELFVFRSLSIREELQILTLASSA